MGLRRLFRKKVKDKEMCFLRDLITVARADGRITNKAREAISEISVIYNIPDLKLYQAFLEPDIVLDFYPIDEDEKNRYLFHLIYILTIDEHYTNRKRNYVEYIAGKMGFTLQDVHLKIECVNSSRLLNTKENKLPLGWKLKSERFFTQEEIDAVSHAIVVTSQYGSTVQFTMKHSGKPCYIPLDRSSKIGIGELVDVKQAKLQTLMKEGEIDIYRVKI